MVWDAEGVVNGGPASFTNLVVTGSLILSFLGAGALVSDAAGNVTSTNGAIGEVLTANGPGVAPTFQGIVFPIITISDITNPGGTIGDMIQWNGAAFQRLPDVAVGNVLKAGGVGALVSYGQILNADVAAAAAIDGTKISPDFGAQDITTTGNLLLGPVTRSTVGLIRVGNNSTIVGARGSGAFDLIALATDASNNVITGDVANVARNLLRAVTAVQIAMATPVLELGTASGANISSIGELRSGTTSTRTLWGIRNLTNAADIALIGVDGNNTWIGSTSANTAATAFLVLNASSAIQLRANSVTKITVDTSAMVTFAAGITLPAAGVINAATSIALQIATVAKITSTSILTTINNTTVDIQSGGTSVIKAGAATLGFFNIGPVARIDITGSRVANPALADLLTKMASTGFLTDSTII